jgi:hypothetical protein
LATAIAVISADAQVMGWIQSPVQQVLPAAVPVGIRRLLADGAAYMTLALPGVVFAAYIVSRQVRARETYCRRCGYVLRGLVEPRCPACEEPI